MTYIFLYRTGTLLLTEEQKKESRQVWDTWNTFLKETYGIRTAVGKVVTAAGVVDYRGDLKGASIIEADSLAEAVEIAKKSPTVKYGGAVEVLEEFQG
ncbi:MAG: YciI family protein [Flavobacteriales bacterium]